MLQSSQGFSGSPSFYEELYTNNWQMSNWEKHCLISIIHQLNPEIAIEIGNADGGSLQVLSKLVPKVYALDLFKEVHDKLRPQFPNVEFQTGDSKDTLPVLLKKIGEQNEKLGLVIIDGDHSAEGVRADIDAILENYIPVSKLVILCHDSFNPECRKGIHSAAWQNCPYVHYVEIDYVPGGYVNIPYKGKMQHRTMWGGFALAILEGKKRSHELVVGQVGKELYNQVLKGSFYMTFSKRLTRLLKGKNDFN